MCLFKIVSGILSQDSKSVFGLAILLGQKVTMGRLRSLQVMKGRVFKYHVKYA